MLMRLRVTSYFELRFGMARNYSGPLQEKLVGLSVKWCFKYTEGEAPS